MKRLFQISFVFISCSLIAEEPLLDSAWKQNGFATPIFEINGTESRNNPIRRALRKPFTNDELYARFTIRYDAESIDTPAEDEGEFFVMWLDAAEGNDGSTHSGGIPNVGIHVSGDQNRFMARYSSGGEKFGPELVGDQDFQVVARLWKSKSGDSQPFDQLNLWVDPKPDAEFTPQATASIGKTISVVNWIGFSTGGKTEPEDRIFVSDIALSTSWCGILGLPPELETPAAAGPTPPAERTIDFDEHVFPILDSKCFSCHAGEEAKKGIRLDIHDEVLGSQLLQKVIAYEMPPEDEPQLTKAEIATLQTWFDEGLAWNAERLPHPRPETDHWAFQPIERPAIPKTNREDWIRTPVDAFIARKQEALGVSAATEADSPTLARRMSLDLLGLPPNGETRSLDVLLDDPAYGERWGRHWLDVARWAESNGHQHNRARPYAWRYRDWVIDAFNTNLPFDQFLEAQIAGDELESVSPTDESRLVATGFLAAARYSGNELDKQIQRNDILVDIVNTTTNAFLGLSFECAQCHTHKFDPITIRDYYRMQAFFANGQPGNVSFISNQDRAAELTAERWEIFDQTYDRLVEVRRRQGQPNPELVIPKTVVSRISETDKKRFQNLESELAKLSQTWAFYSPGNAANQRVVTPHEMRWPLERDDEFLAQRKTRILPRGDVNAFGPEVEPGWPLVFGPTTDLGDQPRAALAQWMTGPDNPLTARVWVNRVWHWHFGKGIVETGGDFGKQGAKPSHPQLLDFLASELIKSGWATRHIHKLIVDSATYRQSSMLSEQNAEIDPDNTTYWRWNPRRLESEAIRDSMLAVSGKLDRKPGGPSDDPQKNSTRRSIYLRQHRDRFPNQQMLFDGAGGVVSCAHRRVSTNAIQPLWLLNSDFCQSAAAGLANRVETVAEAFAICLGREPNDTELDALQTHADKHGLSSTCLVLLNTSEFLYIP
ncbi:MAG: PSD1 and planctomycete cytochrome C domain-containing protein [Verrucomicrobiota bacterium]